MGTGEKGTLPVPTFALARAGDHRVRKSRSGEVPMHHRVSIAAFAACTAFAAALPLCAQAQGVGEGACVISASATVYADDTGDKVVATKEAGECVAGVTLRVGGFEKEFAFHESNGRLRVNYFAGKDAKGMPRFGWMDPADLNRFTYECGCGTNDREKDRCTPFSGSFVKQFNPCFRQARDKALAEGGTAAARPPSGKAAAGAEKALRNDDVITLVKVGLEESLIISKIKSAKATNFDLSTDGLVALKTANVPKGVLEAMMKKQ
ncbi:MAG: hypothetical protein ABR538_06340 [Candidatus Binatia bacterium]